ncbi:ARM repeat superfamily protein [Tasmannia lanceolata]|uniref:ARM repeat superfamily protein n=1 Tax=Tasmannia lanceolata TaxID=3420 RepID=UPI00406311FA
MDGLEMEEIPPIYENEDICEFILSRFKNSMREDHQHLCAVVGAISQELKDHKIPLTPIAYFGATVSSLDRLSSDSSPSISAITAILTLLSTILPRISPAVLARKYTVVSESVSRILGHGSLASVGAVKAGLKCISHLIIVGDKVNWSSIAPSYGILLSFVTDNRPKVRKHAHSCLHDVLQSFQGSAVLASASEGITNIFQRFILLAGGSNPITSATEGPKGAMEVLYILSALKDCLPLMSIKFTTNILKCFKPLLELRHPIVTRHIMNILQALCSNPSSRIAPDVLLDLLCLLALSLSSTEKSADGMTFTARLLHVGIEKVFVLNRDQCVVKLPIVFNALGEILACDHEEAIFAAMEALKGLIHACIDESLIKQGVDQIKVIPLEGTRSSGPTIIEKLCTIIESLLGYQYNAVWGMSFEILSAMFDKLGESSSYLVRGTIKSLADMQNLPDEDLAYRKQLHDCVGSALGAVGPEIFLSILPLNLDSEELSGANVWLLPVLKQYTVGARLRFFQQSILGLAGLMQQKSRMLEKEGRIFTSRSTEALVYSLWSLLPSFCNYPIDTANSFKGLTKALCIALSEEPDLRGIICSSLQILIQQNKKVLAESTDLPNDEISIPERRARDYYSRKVAADNLNAIKLLSPEFISVLSKIFLESSKDSGGCLQSTIGAFASVSEKKSVRKFFKITMRKLLEVTKEAVEKGQPRKSNSMQIDDSSIQSSPSLARAQLFDVAVSLLPGLDTEDIDLLFIPIMAALKDEEGLVQKRAYKTLSIILRERDEFLSSKLDDLLKLMIEVLPSCHFSAKRHRLDSLYFLIAHVAKDESAQRKRGIIISFLTELILALKEANKKTRNRAYDLLVKIGHACGDEDQGGKKENLQEFFSMVAGGLAGETPHTISAAVKAIGRLAYEFSDLVTAAYNLLPSALLLLQRKNREIIKASLGLIKVLVAKSQAESLQTHLNIVVEGLLKWQDDTKNHFKAKVKFLLEMLVRKCGLDAVKAVMPEEHMKLLSNIRKAKERKERRIAAKSEGETRSLHSSASTTRLSRWNHTKIFSDFGDEDSEDSDAEHIEVKTVSGRGSKAASEFNPKGSSLRSMRIRRAGKSLPEDLFDELEDGPLDLLDRQKTRSALRSLESLKQKKGSDDELEIDSDGRLIIDEDRKPKKRGQLSSDHEMDKTSQAGTRSVISSLTKVQKRRKTSDSSGWAYTGSEYTSKKASGDLKRKDKLEPYAYWPLDRKMLSRREDHKVIARKGMERVLKLTKKLEGKSASSALTVKGLKFKRKQKKGGKKSR